MSPFRRFWSYLDGLQHRTAVKVVLTVIAAAVVVAVFGRTWWIANDARSRFNDVVEVLRQANSVSKEAVSTRLLETGEVEAGGRVYGGPLVQSSIERYFDQKSGELMQLAEIAAILVSETIPGWLPASVVDRPDLVAWAGVAVFGWFLLVVWTGGSLPVAMAIVGTLAAAFLPWWWGYSGVVVSILGVGILTTTFLLLIRLLMVCLGILGSPRARPGRHGTPGAIVQTAAVAQTLVRESVRLRISAAFIVLTLVCLPLIPLWIDPGEPVRYQIQNFLSDSMSLVYVFAACMTLVLACATVSFEIRDRQIWHLASKPLGRLQYIVGKWMGIVLLNLILLLIGGISIFGFTQYLGTRAVDPLEVIEVHDEILTARIGVRPTLETMTVEEVRGLAYEEYQKDSITRDKVDRGEVDEVSVIRDIAGRIRREQLDRQRSVAPGGLEDGKEYDARIYEFTDLDAARRSGKNLTLRYRFHIGRSESTDRYPIVFRFPDTLDEVSQEFVPEQRHRLLVPSEFISQDGVLRVQILNGGYSLSPSEDTRRFFANGATLMFEPEGFEVMWQAASFETNFLRAMLVNWVKLGFLAMLGVVTATFLSFPVAILLSFTVFVGGSASPFIAVSLGQFRPDGDAIAVIRWIQYAIAAIASGAEWLLRPFGETSPNRSVVEGRLVSIGGLGRDILVIGIFWCSTVLAIGWMIFRRRELATYSGHG